MGGLALAVHEGQLDVLETSLVEEFVEFQFREAEPDILVEFAGLLEVVFQQIQDHEASAGTGDAVGFTQGLEGFAGVVKGLAEEGEVNFGVADGWRLDIA